MIRNPAYVSQETIACTIRTKLVLQPAYSARHIETITVNIMFRPFIYFISAFLDLNVAKWILKKKKNLMDPESY